MNSSTHSDPSGGSALGLLLVIAFSVWCWLGRGPYFLRWPLLLLTVLMTSGHAVGGVINEFASAIASPVLTILLILFGISVMLRGLWPRHRDRYYRDRHRYNRRRYDERW